MKVLVVIFAWKNSSMIFQALSFALSVFSFFAATDILAWMKFSSLTLVENWHYPGNVSPVTDLSIVSKDATH